MSDHDENSVAATVQHITLAAAYLVNQYRAEEQRLDRQTALEALSRISAFYDSVPIRIVFEKPTAGSGAGPDYSTALNAHPDSDLGRLIYVAFGPDDADMDELHPRYRPDLDPEALSRWRDEILVQFLDYCNIECQDGKNDD